VPIAAAVTALGLIYYLRVGNPLVWDSSQSCGCGSSFGWLAGLIFYFSYGRNKSTVALEEAAGSRYGNLPSTNQRRADQTSRSTIGRLVLIYFTAAALIWATMASRSSSGSSSTMSLA